MWKTIARIVSKSVMKTGESERGKWNLINFFIEKTINKKKEKIMFTAMGKKADFIDSISIGEKLIINCYPKCKENRGYWNTDLMVIDVEKYIKKNAIPVSLNGEVVNKEDFLPKLNNELKFNKPLEANPVEIKPTEISYCRKCGTKVMGVEFCAMCEFGH